MGAGRQNSLSGLFTLQRVALHGRLGVLLSWRPRDCAPLVSYPALARWQALVGYFGPRVATFRSRRGTLRGRSPLGALTRASLQNAQPLGAISMLFSEDFYEIVRMTVLLLNHNIRAPGHPSALLAAACHGFEPWERLPGLEPYFPQCGPPICSWLRGG